jgi:serine/threonine protein kinase
VLVELKCPNPACGKGQQVEDDMLGRRARCRHCGQRFTLSTQVVAGGQSLRSTVLASPVEPVGELPDHNPPEDLPPRFGRFEVRARLGVGAMGVVYRAFDPVLGREVAVKVPHESALANPQAVARFLREPKAAAQLRHPHIVPVYDAGTDQGRYYITSAFIEGRTLEDTIDERSLDFRRAAQIARDLADGLAYAHSLGIVHRDVKPANIMIDARGDALLMDFGLAHWELGAEKLRLAARWNLPGVDTDIDVASTLGVAQVKTMSILILQAAEGDTRIHECVDLPACFCSAFRLLLATLLGGRKLWRASHPASR